MAAMQRPTAARMATATRFLVVFIPPPRAFCLSAGRGGMMPASPVYDGNRYQGGAMKNFLLVFAAAAVSSCALTAQEKINPTDPQPTCAMCPGTLIPLAELEAYKEKAIAEKLVDQQVRDIDIGKARIGIGMVYRRKLDKPAPDSVAEHDQVSEVYHIISGSATLVLGPDIADRQRRPATLRTVVEFNGPGNNGSDIRNGVAHQIKAGGSVVLSSGAGPPVHPHHDTNTLPS